MIIWLAVILLARGIVSDGDCSSSCRILFPHTQVCGSDGRLYPSECHLNCQKDPVALVFSCPFGAADARCLEECGEARPRCARLCGEASGSTLYCTSNGRLFTSLCHLSCADEKAHTIFECSGSFQAVPCTAKCLSTKNCLDFCGKEREGRSKEPLPDSLTPEQELALRAGGPSGGEDNSTPFCYSNGKVYSDRCRASCIDREATPVIRCPNSSFSGLKYCRDRCQYAYFCSLNCPSFRDRWCASDGKIYENICKARCVNDEIDAASVCTGMFEEGCNCKPLDRAISDCEKRCPLYVVPQAVCATDGKVYLDSCRAKCASKQNEVLFQCEFPAEAEDCKMVCARKAAEGSAKARQRM